MSGTIEIDRERVRDVRAKANRQAYRTGLASIVLSFFSFFAGIGLVLIGIGIIPSPAGSPGVVTACLAVGAGSISIAASVLFLHLHSITVRRALHDQYLAVGMQRQR